MISQEQIRYMQEEREREVEAELRIRRLLGTRRPLIRWLPHRQQAGSRRR